MKFFLAFYSPYTNELFTCFHMSYTTLSAFIFSVRLRRVLITVLNFVRW